jgi:arylsulfatase A-like enzyme
MRDFLRTARWTVLASVFVWTALSAVGIFFLLSHDNAIAKGILGTRRAALVSVYLRIFLGYLLTGAVAALLLHPFVPGRKAALFCILLYGLALLRSLTSGTHLLYGPVHNLYCDLHDSIPAVVRNLYRPYLVDILLGGLALASAVAWARRFPRRVSAAAGLACAVAAGATFLARAEASGHPSCFVLIASDSFRADRLSCNGHPRQTTPHIDALAARGTNFRNCLVATASTHESWVSMLTSTEPRENGLRHMFPSREEVERIGREQVFLPRVLAKKGWSTAAVGGWCATTFRLFDTGFGSVDVSQLQNDDSLIAEAALTNHLVAASFLDNPVGRILVPEFDGVSFTRGSLSLTRRACDTIDRLAAEGRPFFLSVVYHATHLPYSAHQPYCSTYTDPDYRGRNRYRIDFGIDEMIQRGFAHDLTPEERSHIHDLYDGCVRELDDQVGAIVEHLRRRGLLDRALVGVIADHGDDLYEPGCTLGHGVTLFGGDQANRIPAVFSGPGVPRRDVEELVRSIDLAPTWLRWLGVEKPAKWRGLDLSGPVPRLHAILETSYLLYRQPVPDLRPGEKVKEFPRFDSAVSVDPSFNGLLVLRPALRERLLETKCFAVREGTLKLIRVPGEEGPIWRLYDLATDPHCERDLAAGGHPELERLQSLLSPPP